MKEKIIYLLLSLMLLASCTGNRKYDDLMQRADSIMDADDDSATVAIRMLDGVKSLQPEFTKGQRMRYELLRHKAMNKAYVSFTSDSIMKEVVDYYDHHGSANERMLAYYVLGCVYRDLHEAPLALEKYNKATEFADTAANDCDYKTLSRIYYQMGILFDKQYLPYQELKAFDKAEKYAYLAKDTLKAIVFYQNKEAAYNYLNDKDAAIAINLHAAKLFRKYGYEREARIAFGCNYAYYMEKKDYKKAQKAFKAYSMSGYEGNAEYADAKAYVLYEKGLYYMSLNQLDSASHYLQHSFLLSHSLSVKSATSKALAQYYLKVNQSALAAKYALISSAYNDSDLIEARRTQLQQMQAMYDYSRHQGLAVVAEKKAMSRTRIIYMLIIVGFVFFVLISFLYRRMLVSKKRKLETAEHLYEDSLIRLNSLQMEWEELSKEKDSSLALVIREKEEAISGLKEELKDILDKYSVPLIPETDVLLKNSSIYKKLQYIEMHPKKKMEEEDWRELATTVERIIPPFVHILKDMLSEQEYRVCLLVRLGVPVSFVGTLVGLSVSGVSAIRKRMLEKVCHQSGSPKDFDNFIFQLSEKK